MLALKLVNMHNSNGSESESQRIIDKISARISNQNMGVSKKLQRTIHEEEEEQSEILTDRRKREKSLQGKEDNLLKPTC